MKHGGLYARSDAGQVVIEGTSNDLIGMSKSFICVPSRMPLVLLSEAEVQPWPFSLRDIHVSDYEGKLHFSLSGSTLTARGNEPSRLAFAEDVFNFASDKLSGNSTHIHIEYYPDHWYLVEGSIPIILQIVD